MILLSDWRRLDGEVLGYSLITSLALFARRGGISLTITLSLSFVHDRRDISVELKKRKFGLV